MGYIEWDIMDETTKGKQERAIPVHLCFTKGDKITNNQILYKET